MARAQRGIRFIIPDYNEKWMEGYMPANEKADGETGREAADRLNQREGITKAQEEAMLAGSMFGWAVPAADPKNYDEHGKPVKVQHKTRDDAR